MVRKALALTALAEVTEFHPNRGYEVIKRLFDISAAVLGIVLLSPVLLIIAVAVKLSSPGPILYRGTRAGRLGVPFQIMKFRSMYVGSDRGAGTTSRDDPRVTPVGKILRKFKLDELPQLFNVLLGDMSVVGPRPELLRYTEQYTGDEKLILAVRPGITDFSSIQFSNLNELIGDEDPDREFETKVLAAKNKLRIKYVRERGFLLDLQLITQTLLRVARLH